ncbi:MAG TPA: DUF6431 domain-containing protein [Humisphaera sp.]
MSPVAIVWPCPLPVGAYAAAGREVVVPRPDCPACGVPMMFWSGYRRHVRVAGACRKIFVPRLRCGRCGVTHALLPAFVLAWRLDVSEAVGSVIARVAGGPGGVRPAAVLAGVPHSTARGWDRRFRARAPGLAAAFAALAVELGGEPVRPDASAGRFALEAITAAFGAAAGLPGWLGLGRWRFASAVSGGTLIAANAASPYLMVGKRRFMPPVPSLPA